MQMSVKVQARFCCGHHVLARPHYKSGNDCGRDAPTLIANNTSISLAHHAALSDDRFSPYEDRAEREAGAGKTRNHPSRLILTDKQQNFEAAPRAANAYYHQQPLHRHQRRRSLRHYGALRKHPEPPPTR